MIGLVREKAHNLLVMPRRDKSLGDKLLECSLFPGLFYFVSKTKPKRCCMKLDTKRSRSR